MPLARIAVPHHLPAEKVRALADAVHRGLVGTCNVPEKDRFQLVTRFADGMMILDPTFPDVARTRDACVVEIAFLKGRTREQKRLLFRAIADGAVAAGFAGDDIFVALVENGAEDWSLGHGVAYADVAHR
jgi:hypothetical protein